MVVAIAGQVIYRRVVQWITGSASGMRLGKTDDLPGRRDALLQDWAGNAMSSVAQTESYVSMRPLQPAIRDDRAFLVSHRRKPSRPMDGGSYNEL